MEIRKIKFPGKLFKKKMWVLSDSEEAYNYFTNTIDFDPVYFASNEEKYGHSIKELFEKIDYNTMSLSYIEDDINVSFHIEFLDFRDITYKEFKQESRCNSYLGQFLYETGFGHLYLIRVYGDF